MRLLLKVVPDQYRGDLSCVEIVTPHTKVFEEESRGMSRYAVYVAGEYAGEYHEYRGPGSFGKLAASRFRPSEELFPEGETR